MYYGIYDEITIQKIKPTGQNTILIIINDSNSYEHNKIENISVYKDILELYIYDIDNSKTYDLNKIFQELNNFILDNEFDEIIIHCSMGLSHSPAIMLCVAKILNNKYLEEEIKEKFKFYNKHIVEKFSKYSYIVKQYSNKEVSLKPPSKQKILRKDMPISIM